jgi:predicted dinucleotide-binding enzyme
MKKIFGIIGAGNIAQALAPHLLLAGHQVILSNTKGPETLQKIIVSLGAGAKAGTSKEAAEADIILLALPWTELASLNGLTDWNNRIVIDATNCFITLAPDFKTADLSGRPSSEVVAGYVPGARLVKAFNTLHHKLLAKKPQEANGKRVLFISGDDQEAKTEVSHAIESMGFAPVDLGSIAEGSKLHQTKGPLAGLNLIKAS